MIDWTDSGEAGGEEPGRKSKKTKGEPEDGSEDSDAVYLPLVLDQKVTEENGVVNVWSDRTIVEE